MAALQRQAVTAFVGLGANLGEPAAALRRALDALAQLPHTQLVQSSPTYCSAPVDSSGPDYLNAVAELLTLQSAPDLLVLLQKIEQLEGRERPSRNAPRTLDLDLLLYGDARISSPSLTVPHPRMGERAFVLLPLADLAPQRVTPAALAAVQGQRISRID